MAGCFGGISHGLGSMLTDLEIVSTPSTPLAHNESSRWVGFPPFRSPPEAREAAVTGSSKTRVDCRKMVVNATQASQIGGDGNQN